MRIVHAIHDFLPLHRGGSEIYAATLCRELARRHDVTVLCAEYDSSRPHGSVERREFDGLPVVEIINNWAFGSLAETYQSATINRPLDRVLAALQPDVLHVHNLLNLSMDLPAIAKARGIPSVATLHDYTLVCPSGGQRVHIAEQHVCVEIEPERCARCFPQSHFYSQMAGTWREPIPERGSASVTFIDAIRRRLPGALGSSVATSETSPVPRSTSITADDISTRLAKIRHVFDAFDLLVAPSAALGAEYRRLGLPDEKLHISDYGFVPFRVARRPPGERLRIGFVGTLVWHKGVHVLVEAVQGLPADRFELKLFGNLNYFPDYVRSLRERSVGAPVLFMGDFDHSSMQDIYGDIDVLVVPSLWPENSPLVIHEAFMAGVPVIGSRQGGIPELVTHDRNGLIYEAYSAVDLRAALARLLAEPELVRRFASDLPAVKSIQQDAAQWEAVYDRVIQRAVSAAIARS